MTKKAEREAYLAQVGQWRATGVTPAVIAERVAQMPKRVCFKVVGALTPDEAAALRPVLHDRFARRAAALRQAGRDLVAWLGSLPRRQQPYAEGVLTPNEQATLAADRARRQAATQTPARPGQVPVKALKVTVVVPAEQLPPLPEGEPAVLVLTTPDQLRVTARLNPKSYRRALATMAQHGVESVTVLVQGQMSQPDALDSAGISAVLKTPKAAEPEGGGVGASGAARSHRAAPAGGRASQEGGETKLASPPPSS